MAQHSPSFAALAQRPDKRTCDSGGGTLRANGDSDQRLPRLLGIFAAWRLTAYGLGIAIVYATAFVHLYRVGAWIVDGTGSPIYTDFTNTWIAGSQALHGTAASVYGSAAEYGKIQQAVVGAGRFLYSTWPYPPTFFLILAPLAALPYLAAFLTWDVATLAGCVAVVYLVVQRRPAVALLLASPFTAWNFLAAQNGFLTASLLGGSLLFLERRPAIAGVFIGCLTYKPQFGVLLPVALAAAHQWRAFASAAITFAVLAGLSIAVFGIDVWEAFPRGLAAQTGVTVFAGPDSQWGYLQTIYGLVRTLHGGAALGWLAQAVAAGAVAVIVWLVWRSPVRYALKAATLSAAALIATPYAFTYDMAAIAVPVAFLARDQISCGLMRGEQTIMIALFGAILAAFAVLGDSPHRITFGGVPLGSVVMITLLGVILRRAVAFGSRTVMLATDDFAFMKRCI